MQPPTSPRRDVRPTHELDGLVANIELTVISIIQGIALSFLVESTRVMVAEQRWSSIPYLAAGLLILFALWARAALHAFTVIRWPLEFGHNFIYFGGGLVEALLFTQMNQPLRWYPIGAVLVLLFWLMFFYERRMYRLRREDSAGPRGAALLDLLEAEHELNLRALMPALLVSWALLCAVVFGARDLMLRDGWHVALGALQAAGLLGYLRHVLRFYHRISGLIVDARDEWGQSSR